MNKLTKMLFNTFKMRYILLILTVISLAGCRQKSTYPGYIRIDGDVYYQLIVFGDKRETAKPEDYVTFDIAYRTMNDSLFFIGRRTMQLTEPDFKGSIDYCFLSMAEYDSASFIIDAQGLFEKTLGNRMPSFLDSAEMIKVDIKMIVIRNQEQYRREKEEFLAWIRDFGDYEQTVLKNFIEEKDIKIKPTETGMYLINTRKGTGKKVERGDIVTVNYDGKFLNGTFFDSTNDTQQPFEFVYGTEWQVIKGLEEAIGYMTEGDKAIVIIPSGLAWGERGSSTGIIPPFTTVLYELELISVKTRDDLEQQK